MPVAPIVLPPLPRLPAAVPRSGVSSDARRALRQLLGDVDRALATAFRDGADASALARRRSESVQRIVVHVWSACLGDVSGAALFAVGGFGRGLLFPYSDVDLLALVGPSDPARLRALEQCFATLWDIGLKVGHAVRDLAQCRALAAHDASVFTSLLDARRLVGDPALEESIRAITTDPALWPPAAYLAVRLAERDARHARYNDTAYNLEPNLKDGPGGLRTLDALRWLGRRLAHADDFDDMVGEGLLDPAEKNTLEQAEATLRRYRFALASGGGACRRASAVRLPACARRAARFPGRAREEPRRRTIHAGLLPRRQPGGAPGRADRRALRGNARTAKRGAGGR